MVRELELLPLFQQFIQETLKGRRRKSNGERIKPQTTANYQFVLNYLRAFELHIGRKLRIKTGIKNNRQQILGERTYWKKFYRQFSDFLFKSGCYDNFVGNVFKTLKCFFRDLKNEKYMLLQECYEKFYVRHEDIRVIALLPRQYCFLILEKDFEEKLLPNLKRSKDYFVFGCSAALRYSDLMHLRVKDVQYRAGDYFLVFHSVKTSTAISVKLPDFAVKIFLKYSRCKGPRQQLFPRISKNQFNRHLKKIGELAGWTELIGKYRTRNGRAVEIKLPRGKFYRFCDQLSSHVMRKTGITVMLMLGMPEHLVRSISGHAAHSESFYRYVHVAQSHVTEEIDKMHKRLLELYS